MSEVKELNIPTTYDPAQVEAKWYKFWEENGFFHAEVEKSKKPYTIVMPPPNVTGALHMGHAMDNTLQDILIRWRRMQGYNTLWMPGTDHAGIATQAKVEEQLAKEGTNKYELGRDKFLERVWDWKAQYGNRITTQLRSIGSSCDWERERFTMDEGCSKAVKDIFVDWYNQGLIYRGNYIINWCPGCQTTISDIEVEHEDTDGKFYHIRYPGKDGGPGVVVATTRPETMLGDVAVAVHPEDDRYRELVGKTLILPLLDKEIPVIADEYVDMAFGSGVVKITPAHDPNDFEVGQRHNLPQISVMNKDATMNELAGKYQGMDRYEARKAVIRDLEELGLLVKVEDHNHSVGHCYRCNNVIEPMVSKQWFVKMQPLAEKAIQVVKDGQLRFVPDRFTKTYLGWMENIRDWCISRQLWWGHRIPVWYCQDCGEIIPAKEEPGTCPKCGSSKLEQDPDVLDTWFSSGLWPFSTLGWPEQTAELEQFYPTSVLVTGRDIIFFWVARMIVAGMSAMQEIPFKEVFIHGLVLDSQGRKMSKSLGNGIDPVEIIEKYGADTLRFMLISGNTPGNDLRFQVERLEGTRNFANKIWNASRFVMMNLQDFQPDKSWQTDKQLQPAYTLADRWIISRLEATAGEVTRNLERYDLGEAGRVLYEFIWNEFCDWYIELVKPRLFGKETPESRKLAQHTLWQVLEGALRLLHPFMPFLTEEIWQALPHEGKTIMLAAWPEAGAGDPQAEGQMGLVMEVVKAIRNIRSEMNVPPGRQVDAILAANGAANLAALEEGQAYIINLGHLASLQVLPQLELKPEKAVSSVVKGVELFLPLAGLIDMDKEKERLGKEIAKMDQELARLEGKLGNQGFVAKAPEAVIAKEKAKQEEYRQKKDVLLERLASLDK